jgi:ABC-type polysaccharide/polyol phosphate transport system ATPase subunit
MSTTRTAQETESIYNAIVDYSGLAHFIDVPIKNYSSGMYMRLGFAIAANLNPDILLLDEIFAVGDADFQQRCVGTLKGFMSQGRTIIVGSHSPTAVQAICRRACVLELGELAFDGVTTYPDREPYHYPFALITNVCDALGASVHRVSNARHPAGESVLVISRKR